MNTEVYNGFALKQNRFDLGEIPNNTSRLFDLSPTRFRAIHVNSPLSIETTNDAYLTIDAYCSTKTEVDNSLAIKRRVINNVPGTGERLLEMNLLKRIFAVSPLHI